MRLTCTQENLGKGLNIVARIGEKNNSLPILNNVLLQARKEGLGLVATNLEIGIKTTVRGKIEEPGEFTVNARLIADFINTLKKENVNLILEEKNLHIKGENHETTIRGMDAADFPVVPTVDTIFSFTTSAVEFREALSQVLFSVSTDDSRPELNGVYMQINNNNCVLAATDSYRLSEKTLIIKNKNEAVKNSIIPSKTLHEVLRILDIETPGSIMIAVNENQILFSFGGTEVVSRIINGEYPDYKQIIPTRFKNEVRFNRSEMIQAIKSTSLFCKQGINDVRLSLDKRFKDIAVNAENSTLGKNISNVPSFTEQQEMDIVFNYKFFLDGLNHLIGDVVVVKTNDATSPALFMSASEQDLLYIIMPIKQ